MDIKNIIIRTMAFVAIVAISAAAAMAQTVALKQDTNGKWGIAYTDGRGNWGKWAVKAEYTVIEPFEEGYYLAQKDGKWGILRQNGKKVLDCKYTRDMFSAFGYIFAQEVGKPDKWAVLDRLANSQEWEKTYFKNVSITNVSDSIRVIKGELGVSYLPNNVREDYMRKIDPMWKAMHQPTIEVEYGKSILAMRDGGTVSFAVTKSGIAINDVKNMKHIAGSIYACFSGNMKYYCCDFSNGTRLGIVKSNAQLPTDNTLYVVTNSNGNPIYYISNMGQVCWFERNIEVDGLSCRLISDSNGKYGLVSNDKSSKILLKVEYDKIMDRNREYGGTLYEKYIYICKDGLWGICRNADGQNLKIILDCKYPGYANADSDNNPPFGYARGYERFVVTAEGMAGVIDENGKEVLSCTYDSASYDFYGNGYSGAKSAIFEKDGKSIVYNLLWSHANIRTTKVY